MDAKLRLSPHEVPADPIAATTTDFSVVVNRTGRLASGVTTSFGFHRIRRKRLESQGYASFSQESLGIFRIEQTTRRWPFRCSGR